MTTNSNLCKSSNCVTRVGTSTSVNALSSASSPPALNLGVFDSSNISDLFRQFEAGVVVPIGNDDPITRLIAEYGEETFYSSVSSTNLYFSREDVKSLINANDYPFLNDRLNTEIVLTPIEIAEFTREFGYTPIGLINATFVVSLKLVEEFEAFYVKNFTENTAGSFCALLPNIFGAVGVFFSVLDTAKDLINKFKNFSLNFSLKKLLDQLKANITKVIDKVINKVKSIIENFSMADVLGNIVSSINEKILKQFQKIKETAMAFFDPANLESFKNKIKALIDYATNIFKDPKIEEIQYILFRFCSFISSVENGINDLKRPLDTFANSYRETISILQANSAGNTVRAVRAGATRFDPPMQSGMVEESRQMFADAGNIPPMNEEDYKSITQWNEGKGDSRIRFEGRWVGVLGREGWEKVDANVRAMLMKVQQDFGRQLTVNSGYRSPEYNANTKGASKNSLHMSGLAVDITWPGINQTTRNEFIRIARARGFRGVGQYGPGRGNFVHIDVGRQRTWSEGI